jgi:hypothetical protein
MLWLSLVLFVALAVAVVRGGRLSNLGDIRLRLWPLLPVAFGMQGATALLSDRGWTATFGFWLILVSFVFLLIVIVANKDRKGMWLAGLGVMMNFVVIALNGGMPVLEGAVVVASGFESGLNVIGDMKHVSLDEGTRLAFLADVIPLRLAGQGQVLSLGDVFLAVGIGRFLEAELRRPVRWFKPGVKLSGGSATRV